MKHRNYVFTDFKKEDPEGLLKKLKVVYAGWGLELCPKTKREHWQGFMCFKNPRSWNGLRKLFSHVEPMKGKVWQSEVYCSKDSKYRTIGTKPVGQGKRTDIEVLKSMTKMRDVVEIATNVQQIRLMECYFKYKEEKRTWKPIVYWYHGSSGSGKTMTAIKEAGDDYWISSKSLKWWDGYDRHAHVIIDDFRRDFCTFHELLRILDCTPMRVEHKGGSRELLARVIWITSPYSPEQTYENRTDEDLYQLTRRITETRLFGTEVQGNTKEDFWD